MWVSQTLLWFVRGCPRREVDATYAEKSAAAVAAMLASAESRACQTAPLWPKKVPILVNCINKTFIIVI